MILFVLGWWYYRLLITTFSESFLKMYLKMLLLYPIATTRWHDNKGKNGFIGQQGLVAEPFFPSQCWFQSCRVLIVSHMVGQMGIYICPCVLLWYKTCSEGWMVTSFLLDTVVSNLRYRQEWQLYHWSCLWYIRMDAVLETCSYTEAMCTMDWKWIHLVCKRYQ